MSASTKRKQYDNSFKLQIVLQTYQKENTIESICKQNNLSATVVNKWRSIFKQNAHMAFDSKLSENSKKKIKDEDSPEFLKKVIGDLTVENQILKKASSVWD